MSHNPQLVRADIWNEAQTLNVRIVDDGRGGFVISVQSPRIGTTLEIGKIGRNWDRVFTVSSVDR